MDAGSARGFMDVSGGVTDTEEPVSDEAGATAAE
jgi:hypothetical protein